MSYADPKGNHGDLIRRMPPLDQPLYLAYHSHRTVPCFNNRILVAYTADSRGEPTAITPVTVLEFEGKASTSFIATVEDGSTGVRTVVSNVPVRLPGTKLFLSIPMTLRLLFGLHVETGVRSLAYGIRVSMQDDTRRTPGVQYMDTLNEFRRLFPNAEIPNLQV
jgi:hypothetical protein